MESTVSEPAAPAYKAPLFEPLTRESASLRISSAIEQKILRRSLRPGDALPTETELAEQFAVHRSTVREALRRLESAGLVGRAGGSKKLRVTRRLLHASAAPSRSTTSRSSSCGRPCARSPPVPRL